MVRAISYLALAAVVFVVGSGWIGLYPPVPVDLGGVENLDRRAERLRIPVGTGDALDAWLLPGSRAAVIVIFHGYGRDHTRAWRYARFLRRGGYAILTLDFRSSRASNRLPTTIGTYELEDARAALRWLHAQPRLRDDEIGLFGESLGGSVALVAAGEDPAVRAVAVDGAFANGRRALEEASRRWAHLPSWPSAALARALDETITGHDPYVLDAEAGARALAGRPTFFIHAAGDPRFSTAQAEALWRAAGSRPGGLWVLPANVGHNEGWLKERAEYERRVLDFFERSLPGTPRSERRERPARADRARSAANLDRDGSAAAPGPHVSAAAAGPGGAAAPPTDRLE